MNFISRHLKPVLWVFIFNAIIICCLWNFFTRYHIDGIMLLSANALFLLVSMLVFIMQKKALSNKNPHVFIRSVMAGMMIKMFICVIAVMGYVFYMGKFYDTKTVFISLFIYLFYLVAEVISLMKLNRQQHG